MNSMMLNESQFSPLGAELIQGSGGNATSRASSGPILPDFRSLDKLEVQSTRAVSRLNAATVSEKEYDDLLARRKALLLKKHSDGLTQQEQNKLTYIRWSLDRIDDARHGAALDTLEEAVARYEQFLARIEELQEKLNEASANKRR
ncbi:MAG: hypothetical protein V4801_15230 [Burkholderia gladioli]